MTSQYAAHAQVSCIMTVRNGRETLLDTLESVSAQREIDWELIVVDDGSTDETLDLLQQFARSHPSHRVEILPTGGVGRGAALNLAWRAASTGLIANVDADDLYHPTKLAAQYQVLMQRPDVELLSTESHYIGAGEQPNWSADVNHEPDATAESAAPPEPGAPRSPDVSDVTSLLGRFNPVNHSSVMMRRALLEELNGYDESRVRQLDYDLWVRAAAAGKRIHQLNRPLTAKRLHNRQSFEARLSLAYLTSSFRLQNRAIRSLGLPIHLHALAALRVLYRLLPQWVRRPLARKKRALLSTPDR